MAFRPIKKDELVRGSVCRLANLGGAYDACTIVMVRDGEVHVARPFVYAHQHFDSKSGLIGVENFSMSEERALTSLEVEVDRFDVANKMVT